MLAQNESLARRFSALGAPATMPVGNLKVDAPAPLVDSAALERLRAAFAGRPLLMAASTHDGEDQIMAEAHRALAQSLPGLCTIIAPRHPERGGAITEMLKERGLQVAQRSLGMLPDRSSEAYVADTIGELGMLYKLVPVAFIGGSLVDRGGQNPIEAVRQGAVVLTGPHWQNFGDAYDVLIRNRGAIVVHSAEEMAARRSAPDHRSGRTRQHACPRQCRACQNLGRACRARSRRCCATCRARKAWCVRLDEPSWWYREAPGAAATILQPLAAPSYGWAARARYYRATPYRARLPVICVGNFTAGGTGKTPLAIYLCEQLKAAGHEPVALTRGYGGRLTGPYWVNAGTDRARDVGDEALLLARAAPTLLAREPPSRRARHRERAASRHGHRHGRRLAKPDARQGPDARRRRWRPRARQWPASCRPARCGPASISSSS